MVDIKEVYRKHQYTITGESEAYKLEICPIDKGQQIDAGTFKTVVSANQEARRRINAIVKLCGRVDSYEP